MQNDDEVRDETSSEPKIVRQGRRATYTPPLRTPSAAPQDEQELATALSAGLNWLSTGAIPTAPEPETPQESSAPEAQELPVDEVPAAPIPAEPAIVPPLWESAPAPTSAPSSAVFDEDDDDAVDDPAPLDQGVDPEPDAPAPPTWRIDEPETSADEPASPSADVPPWASLPAPDPAQAVYLPSGPEYSAPAAPEDEPAFETIPWEPRAWEPEEESVDESVRASSAAESVLDADEPDFVAEAAPAEFGPAEEPEPAFASESVFAPEEFAEAAAFAEPVAEPDFAPEPEEAEPEFIEPALVSDPAPVDVHETELPFAPPVRESLADDELASLVDDPAAREGGTLGLIEQFEQQLKLREQEAQKFSEWENSMLSLGTDDAVSEVEAIRTQFTGVIPIITPAVAAQAAGETSVEPELVESEPASEADEPATESEPAPPAAWPSWASAAAVQADPPVAAAPTVVAESSEVDEAPTIDELPAADEPTEIDAPLDEPSSEVADQGSDEAESTDDTAVQDVPANESTFVAEEANEAAATDSPVPVEQDAQPTEEGLAAAEAPTVEDESAEEPAPWWLDEPVAEGIIADSADSAEPARALEVADPIVEPELLEAEEPAEEVIEAEVVEEAEDTPEQQPELQAIPEPEPQTAPPFEPPMLIEPPGYGAPTPVVESDQVSAFTAVPGDTGEVIFAEVVDADIAEVDAAPEPPTAGFVFDAEGAGARSVPAPNTEPAFEEFLAGNLDEEPPQRYDPEPTAEQDAGAEPLFIEPMPVAAGREVPADTGSVSIIDRAYEEELDDDVDDTDRAFGPILGGIAVSAAGTSEVSPQFSPPSEPISIVRLRDDEVVIANNEPIQTPVFSIENSGPEPTPIDRRVGHAARLFWLWFAANSSIVSVALGAVIFGLGMSLRQSIVAILIGVAISFIPLGLSSLAGKRSGQPTMIVSRATFGVMGNVLPSVIALVTRLFWGAVLLWLLGSSVAIVVVGADSSGALGERQVLLISLAIAFVVALLIAFAGYSLLARIQLILSIVSAALIFGLILLTVSRVNFSSALATPDGPWILVITGAVLVFSFVGLVWANSGGDLARYQRPNSSGASSMLWSTFGATLPAFLLVGYGALLAASDRSLAEGFATAPLETLSILLPGWYPIPLIAATALSLLSGVVLTMYSGGFALQAIGVQLSRQWSTIIVGVAVGLLALVFTFAVTGGITELFRDLATTLAVPTAAWAGIFAAETMIRNRRFESPSLLARGGIYPDVRWVNFVGLIVISILGWGLTTATVVWLGWQGYLFGFLGAPIDGDFAGTDIGVLVALVLGLLLPIVAGIPAIRRQEDTRV